MRPVYPRFLSLLAKCLLDLSQKKMIQVKICDRFLGVTPSCVMCAIRDLLHFLLTMCNSNIEKK